MEARVKVLGHPLHQLLIVLPLGLLAGAVLFDILFIASGSGKWADIAYWLIIPGVLSGAVAAVFGWLDWFSIPGNTRAKRVGLIHGLGNAVVLVLFAASGLVADSSENPGVASLVLAFLGGALAVFTGWLGGELVDRLGVGVHDGANLNAPNSLSGRPPKQKYG